MYSMHPTHSREISDSHDAAANASQSPPPHCRCAAMFQAATGWNSVGKTPARLLHSGLLNACCPSPWGIWCRRMAHGYATVSSAYRPQTWTSRSAAWQALSSVTYWTPLLREWCRVRQAGALHCGRSFPAQFEGYPDLYFPLNRSNIWTHWP